MSPIDKISDIRRLPRLGKVRLGIKKEGQRGSYPQAVDYFVCPEEVKSVHGDTPRELPVMFPSDDLELVAPQWYKCYSYSQGLICKGDGKHCKRKVDTNTGDFADRDTSKWEIHDGICDPGMCPKLTSKQCRKMMSLLFILHEVPGLGVYQLDTSSFYSIVNLNSQLAPDGFLRHFTEGRIAFIPLILSVAPQEVTPPGIGRKTVHVLSVRADVKLADLIRISRQRPAQVLLPTLEEEEPPEDLFPEGVIAEAEQAGGGEAPAPISSPEGGEKVGEQVGAAQGGEEVVAEATFSPPKGKVTKPKTPPSAPAAEPEPTLVGEGFNIDLAWLDKALKAIKWDDDTAKTWIAANLKVDTQGELTEVISRLTREQAEQFVREIQERAARTQQKLI
ncbi:hypothetical protein ES703_31188 [subsurface metagenome]